tara:strand:+ start:130 stop:327 length:198 start_codon:yes stop_codon:yes gene_type:complete
MNNFDEENIKITFGEQAAFIIREIKTVIATNKILGKNTFANANMSSGWLTKKKNGQTIFTPKVYK